MVGREKEVLEKMGISSDDPIEFWMVCLKGLVMVPKKDKSMD